MNASSICDLPMFTPFDVMVVSGSKSGEFRKRCSTETVSLQPGFVGSSTVPSGNVTRSRIGTYFRVVVTLFLVGSVPTMLKLYVLPSSGDLTWFEKNGTVLPDSAWYCSVAKSTSRAGCHQKTGV